jgi:hypothetical protein
MNGFSSEDESIHAKTMGRVLDLGYFPFEHGLHSPSRAFIIVSIHKELDVIIRRRHQHSLSPACGHARPPHGAITSVGAVTTHFTPL